MELSLPITIHLVTVIPAVILGTTNLVLQKGTTLHRVIGRIWVVLMLCASLVSFAITTAGGYSWIHILSVITLVSVILGFFAIRRRRRRWHVGCMTGAYVGSLIAGLFAVVLPGRVLYQYLVAG